MTDDLDRTFDALKADAERLVEKVQSTSPDEALILVLDVFLQIRREARGTLLDEFERKLSPIVARERQ